MQSVGCVDSQRSDVDAYLFSKFGGTAFASPQPVTAKELHLDSGALIGKPVVIQGKVNAVGKFATHMVIADETAPILIVVTELIGFDKFIENAANTNIRIFGTLERGKKGLPFIMARGVSIAKLSKKV